MKNIKKVLSICFVMIIAIAIAITSLAIFGKKDGVQKPQPSEEQVNWLDYGIYFASAEEETGASAAPEHMKGGATYIGPGSTVNLNIGTIEYHEGYYGGAFYVANNATLNINGGTIRCNGAMFGGAIYIEAGGTCNINGGYIEYNSAEEGPAIYIESEGELNFGQSITDTGAFLSKNEYADYGEFEIRYYVDGLLTDYSEQKIASFKIEETPLSYAECNGWFYDENMTDPAEEGDVLSYTPEVVTVMGVNTTYRKIINVYTAAATVDKLDFTLNEGDATYCVAGKSGISGRVGIPKEYEGKIVNALKQGAFKDLDIEKCYIPSNISIISNSCFYSSKIKTINLTERIMTIEGNAFRECAYLQEVYILDSVKTIGSSAFYMCTSLEKVNIDDENKFAMIDVTSSAYLFDDNSAELYKNGEVLSILNFDTATYITNYLFTSCESLTEITIGEQTTGIGTRAFYGCENVIKINYNAVDAVRTGGGNIFYGAGKNGGEIVISDSVNTVPNYLFQSTFFTKIIIGEIDSIGENAFLDCVRVEELHILGNISNSITNVFSFNKPSASDGCKIIIGDNVTEIGYWFNGSKIKAKSISIGKSVTNLFPSWGNCSATLGQIRNLESITVSSQNEKFASYGSNIIVEKATKTLVFGCKNSVIPTNGTVTSIGQYAFYNCTELTEITIPNCITSIGSSAFSYCTELTEITIPNSVTNIGSDAFYYCTGLTEISIPNSVTNIGSSAFYYCTKLTEITIPNSVTSIGNSILSGCRSLKTIYFDASNVSLKTLTSGISYDARCNIILGENITTIEDNACYQCRGIESVTLGLSVVSIGKWAFRECTNLTTIISNSNYDVSIGDYAFDNCPSLTSFKDINENNQYFTTGLCTFQSCNKLEEFSAKAKTIGDYSFRWCSSLKDFDFGSQLNEVGMYAFTGCSSLTSVDMSESNISIIPFGLFQDCTSLESFTPCYKLTRIRKDALRGCTSLLEVVLSFGSTDCLTDIDASVFDGCTSLTEIELPSSLKKIRTYAFNNTAITSVTIPASCTRVGRLAFGTTLEEIVFENTTGWNLVAENADGTAYVDTKSVSVTNNTTNISNYLKMGPVASNDEYYLNYYYFEKVLDI